MTEDIPRLIYLVLLLVVIGGSFFAFNREGLGKTAQQAAIWVLIFLGAIAAVGLWSDIQNDLLPRQSAISGGVIEVPKGFDNHYHLTVIVNGTPIDFLVDTGATQIVLSARDAQRIGINTDTLAYLGRAQTANGVVRTAPVTLGLMEVGDIQDTNIRAVVNEGALDSSLLGMSYLNLFESLNFSRDVMTLTR